MLYTLMMIYSFITKIFKCIVNQRHILALDLDKINLDNDNILYQDDPDIIIHVRLLVWLSKFKKRETLKKKNVLIRANTTHTSEISRPISLYWEY